MIKKIVVSSQDAGKRIDKVLAENMPEISRSQVQKMLESGLVELNSSKVKKNYKLTEGDLIEAEIMEESEMPLPQAENIPLDIIFEDDRLILVNKPAGMAVHPSQGNESGTLVNALLKHTGGNLSHVGDSYRPGIVHRIDKDTSGILLVAKDDQSHERLERMIQERKVDRLYLAIVRDNIKEDEMLIDQPIDRDKRNRLRRWVVEGGRPALTRFRVIERFGPATLLELKLETGRTHQIRVHMAYINHPLLGDSMYSSGSKDFAAKRQMLHSHQIRFTHPFTGEYMNYTADPPEDFENLLDSLRRMRDS